MKQLSLDKLNDLRKSRNSIGYGWNLSQCDFDTHKEIWEQLVEPDEKDCSESFALVRADGSETGVYGVRWMFHLFGLCHRAAHVGLTTPSGLILLQKRSSSKADSPSFWDMTVAGHIPVDNNGVSLSYHEGALKEIEEEIGLSKHDIFDNLLDGELVICSAPYFFYEQDLSRNPPFRNAEAQQVFGGVLTETGMAALSPDYDELDGIIIVREEIAWSLLAAPDIAAGLRSSLPRFLDWLQQRKGCENVN